MNATTTFTATVKKTHNFRGSVRWCIVTVRNGKQVEQGAWTKKFDAEHFCNLENDRLAAKSA